MVEQFFVEKKYWWLRHTIFWVLIYAENIFDIVAYYESSEQLIETGYELFWDMVLVYLNIYVLIPKFLVKKKYAEYFLYTFISILIVQFAHYQYLNFAYPTADLEEIDFVGTMITIAFYSIGTLGIAAAIKMTKYFYERQQHLNELREAQLSSEVNYLKQQTNPHFLFNTLNTIYVLAKQKKENTPNAIMLLSDLMRYQTYDTSNEKVPLTKEIEFLENYLELEKLRRDKLIVDFKVNGSIHGELIEPLLFLPFIENAVKHSASTNDQPEHVSIVLTNHQNKLELQVRNTIGKNTLNSIQRENSGFGLQNAKKRIQLLYPDKHKLDIAESDAQYEVNFQIIR